MSKSLSPNNAPAGSRILWCGSYENPRYRTVEVTVVEWAPSRRRVKVRYENGHESWTDLDLEDKDLLEVLSPPAQRGKE